MAELTAGGAGVATASDVVASEGPLDLEAFRGELTGFCYRMLGSTFDADDAVQETLVRAWQARDRFEGRSSLRSWLYRIATNTCLDHLRARKRRALPMDLTGPGDPTAGPGEALPAEVWVEPLPDAAVRPAHTDPAERAVYRETIRLAFVAALQHLPARQRAVLILREVLCWRATEVASLLDTTVTSVNSMLQRARATLASQAGGQPEVSASRAEGLDDDHRELLARYLAAFEAYDIDTLVSLLHEDASIAMPPLPLWLRGRADLRAWYLGHGIGCRGSRLVPSSANGMPAFGQYRLRENVVQHPLERGRARATASGRYQPWTVQVLEIRDGRVAHVHHFLDPALFERFGLPAQLD